MNHMLCPIREGNEGGNGISGVKDLTIAGKAIRI